MRTAKIKPIPIFVLLFCCLWANRISAQELSFSEALKSARTHSQIDTNRLLSDKPLKSPWGAVLRSAIIPGWGQTYNHKYLKAGLALGLNAFMAYHIYWYQHKWTQTENTDFRGKRNLYTWYFALSYLLTMVDAYVDAYLYKFNVAMEISEMISPENEKWNIVARFSFQF
jgi:hypothetical protein